MSRIYRIQSLSSERNKLLKIMVYAIFEIQKENIGSERYKDLSAFIALTSEAIISSIETTIKAWEKRGYWVKADHFREKWNWIFMYQKSLVEIIQSEQWNSLFSLNNSIMSFINDVKTSKTQSIGEPWSGSYNKLKN